MARTRERAWDVVIVGGGIMGCGTAWELARRGARVVVLERSVPGAEASSAAAGILGAQAEAHAEGPLFELSLRSLALYPNWAKALFDSTGIDVELRPSGVLRVSLQANAARKAAREVAFQKKRGCRVELLDAKRLRAELPLISAEAQGAVAFPDDARIDPPRLLRALRIAAERASVEFRSGAWARRVAVEQKRARGVALDDGSVVRGGHVVVAAGSWSSLIEGMQLPEGGVIPARGQIVELMPVVFGPNCYLVPRDDGRVLIGSTLEFVGYRKEVTAAAVRNLLDAALRLVPALADATLNGAWSSFRPYTKDALPWIGEAATKGLLLATGHYRNGILLAPVTAEIITALVLGEPSPLALEALSPQRRVRS
jgi:glycine oxidase